jgi:hypothetical protein
MFHETIQFKAFPDKLLGYFHNRRSCHFEWQKALCDHTIHNLTIAVHALVRGRYSSGSCTDQRFTAPYLSTVVLQNPYSLKALLDPILASPSELAIRLWIPVLLTLTVACNPTAPEVEVQRAMPIAAAAGGPIPYAEVADNVRHDTLLIQVTFELPGSHFIMVASNMEENFEGLRLYYYTLGPDSSANIKAFSSPAYDSWTMLPTLFADPKDSSRHIILANFGERDSWGQKVMALGEQFTDMGFIDVAYPEYVQEEDTAYRKLRNIAPYTRCFPEGSGLRFEFVCDSLYLYDDLRGGLDRTLPSSAVRYTWDAVTEITLWVNGEARQVQRNPS